MSVVVFDVFFRCSEHTILALSQLSGILFVVVLLRFSRNTEFCRMLRTQRFFLTFLNQEAKALTL
jgi:hypothetical protein